MEIDRDKQIEAMETAEERANAALRKRMRSPAYQEFLKQKDAAATAVASQGNASGRKVG